MCLVCLLFASLLIQPIHTVFADEPEVPIPAEPIPAQDVKEQLPTEQPEEVPAQPPPDTLEQPPETSVDVPDPLIEDDTQADSQEEILVPEDIPPQEEPEVSENPESDNPEPQPSDTPAADTSTEQESGTSTEPLVAQEDTVVTAQYLVTEENYYQFSKQSCVSVGDGAYHCTDKDSTDVDSQSVVFAEAQEGGDMEIFLKTTRGKTKQLTQNDYDDTAPHYDPESMRVVWQRLIDGRYQIIHYDIMEEKEVQLTFSKTNNMEPKVSSSGIVWQAWDNNDWEIMLFDGSYTEQLTDNNNQDVTPVIQDHYVLWSVLGSDDQQARVYSLDTKETISITGHEGGAIANPRFVLVYDTTYANGDVITQSFDPATGLSEAIAATPAEEPINIPEPDPIGEIRALIQGKNSQKEDGDTLDLEAQDDDVLPAPPDTLNLQGTTTAPTVSAEEFSLTEYDLVLPLEPIE